ncbi:coproporphyrinogen III oxidase [Sporomusaceae bacterium FL31]|nr:coproporphyrinogen III oxidase [Sporomusaceae bacterium FL31]GCE32407.1 coproporphyrinogen III oxidase [Sporomusaceae bacterium]
MSVGLYVHIPFCKQKCYYCDFPSYAGLEHLYKDYVAALVREISDQGGLLSESVVDSIFIGGGTPTVLPTHLLVVVLENIKRSFRVAPNAEISIEANPGTTEKTMLQEIRRLGVNRISFGVQSFSNDVLREIGRIHTAETAVDSVVLAQDCGFTNINIDLMYGLPNQSLEQLKRSLLVAYQLEIQHLSVYGLKVEEGTCFAELEAEGALNLPGDDEDEAMYELSIANNTQHGFKRYEISNFAKLSYECRHNLKYWYSEPYLGLGAAAHSFLDGVRRANVSSVKDYIECSRSGKSLVASVEQPTVETAMAEFSFLALRTVRGISIRDFNKKFNNDFFAVYQHRLNRLERMEAILSDGEYVWLTPQGMKFGNAVFREFLL